jgi:2-oxo-4-hydroxy-4-carboxy-5-ureidoimidazoline decarboxylase
MSTTVTSAASPVAAASPTRSDDAMPLGQSGLTTALIAASVGTTTRDAAAPRTTTTRVHPEASAIRHATATHDSPATVASSALGVPMREPAPAASTTAVTVRARSAVMSNVRQTMMDVTETALRGGLAASLSVNRWIDEVASHHPFPSVEQLLLVATDAASPLSPQEIDEAIAHHPRIGEKPVGEGRSQEFSRAEQSALGDEDALLAEQIAAGNAAYEERFGRVFIIRAAGRTRADILSELTRRLELPNATELEIVGEQLREIALLRLVQTFGTHL